MGMLKRILAKLSANEGLGKYAKNASWLFAEKAFRALEAFVVGLWIARYLGPADFGIFTYAVSFVFLFTAIATLGLDQIVVKELVKDERRKNVLLGTTLGLRLMGFVLMISLILLSLQFTNNSSDIDLMILIIGCSVLFQSFVGIDLYFQSKVRSKYIAYINIAVIFISALIKIYLIVTNAPVVHFAYVFIVETFLTGAGFIGYYLSQGFSIGKWKFSLLTAKSLLSRSWFLIIGTIATAIYMKIDQVMIKEIISDEAVGFYGAAVKTCSIWLFVTVVITQSVFPAIVQAKQRNRQLFLDRLQMLYNLLLKISVLASILYTLFSQQIIAILFGSEYAESAPIMVIYIWSVVFVFLSNGSWGYYLNEDLEKFSSIRLVIGAIINVILNLVLIEYYGLYGAAYATLISYSISGYFVNALFPKTRTNFILQTRSIANFFKIRTWVKPLTP